MRTIRPALLAGLLALLATACHEAHESPETRFGAWVERGHREEVAAYHAFLKANGVVDALPLHQLLASGRRWKSCGHDAFSIPPRDQWPAMVPTLRLVDALKSEGYLQGAVAVSAYRDAVFNACEGGSTRSRHMANTALDFDSLATGEQDRLCAWWKIHGKRHGFGLGFYGQDRIHVDTAGHRTWGHDYTGKSSPCR